MKKKLIYIEWADATHPEDASWYSEESLKEWAKDDSYWVSQCGFVIEENKNYLLLAGMVATTTTANSNNKTNQLGSYLKIPKPWVRKRIDLTKYIK